MSEFPPPDPTPDQRAGVWTSEFWMSLACLACGMWLIARGREELATWLIGIATGGYQGARAWTKGKTANAT